MPPMETGGMENSDSGSGTAIDPLVKAGHYAQDLMMVGEVGVAGAAQGC